MRLWALKETYAEIVLKLGEALDEALSGVSGTGGHSGAPGLLRARTLRNALELARTESDRLDAHFKAWRATTLQSHVEQHEYLITLGELRNAGIRVAGGDDVFEPWLMQRRSTPKRPRSRSGTNLVSLSFPSATPLRSSTKRHSQHSRAYPSATSPGLVQEGRPRNPGGGKARFGGIALLSGNGRLLPSRVSHISSVDLVKTR